MSNRNVRILRAGLNALYHTGAHKILEPVARGVGVIFMLHRVVPGAPRAFSPNRILQITPEFLDSTLTAVRREGFDIVSLDEAHSRMREGNHERPFAVFTLDDGYRDNRDHALPVFQKHKAPFTVYVPSDFADGRGFLWWLALEELIATVDQLTLKIDGHLTSLVTTTDEEKSAAFDRIYWWLRSLDERVMREEIVALCRSCGLDPYASAHELLMNWDELRAFAREDLVTIGGHTRRHYALGRLPYADAKQELTDGLDRLEQELGTRPEHFSFPYGDKGSAGKRDFEIAREAGLKTAVTTRKGLIYAEHADHLTALPRVSLNGDYQELKYISLYLTGVPFALLNRFKRVDAT